MLRILILSLLQISQVIQIQENRFTSMNLLFIWLEIYFQV